MYKIYGVGINDYEGKVRTNGKTLRSYQCWKGLLSRCYSKKSKAYKTYGAKGVYVCDEWLLFSNFKKWYDENYIEGYQIDKDKLNVTDINGNKYYSPESCCFISQQDNLKEMQLRLTEDSKVYETKPVERKGFKYHCKAHGKNFEDFVEIKSEIKKHYLYFYKASQSPEKLKELLDIEMSQAKGVWYEKYSEKSTPRYNFYRRCITHKVSIDDFIEIPCDKVGEYNYYCIKDLSDVKLEELIKEQVESLWYMKYKKTSNTRRTFKKACETHNVDFNDFIEVLCFRESEKEEKRYLYYEKNSISDLDKRNIEVLFEKTKKQPWYKKYEEMDVSRGYFKDRCRVYETRFEDFFELKGDGEDKYRYYFIHEQSKEKINDIMTSKKYKELLWFTKYEEIPTYRSRFKSNCKKQGIPLDDFIEIKSCLKGSGNTSLYFYYNIKTQTDENLRELIAIKDSQPTEEWYKKYETKPLLPHNFKDICSNHDCDLDSFRREDSGETHRGRKMYFYFKK